MSAVVMPELDYPDDNGEPMAENTLQFEWIVTLKGGLDALFRADPDVFVAGDLLWYPVHGQPRVRLAPDAMVAFGRPKKTYRGSYKQWEEDNVAPQVVFEVISPSNHAPEMRAKHAFYERHGVEEYYVYDPDRVTLVGFLRDARGRLAPLAVMEGHVSPRLGVRFELADQLVLHTPDGGRFRTYMELVEEADRDRSRANAEIARAEAERDRAEAERDRAEAERDRAQVERGRAQVERDRAEALLRANEALRAKLRAAGIDPDAV